MKQPNRRQKIRGVISLLVFVLFPVLFYYFSPVIPLAGSAEGIVSGSLILFVGLFFSSMLLGRSFCSWICPAGTLQDMTSSVQPKSFPRARLNIIKYLVWAPWLVILFMMFRSAGGLKGIDPLYATVSGISVTSLPSVIIYSIVVLVFFLMPLLFGRRASCHTICWMAPFMILGRALGSLLTIPSWRIASAPEGCTSCGRCTEVCPMSLNVQQLAAQGAILSSDCILCGKCVDTCTRKTLSFKFSR